MSALGCFQIGLVHGESAHGWCQIRYGIWVRAHGWCQIRYGDGVSVHEWCQMRYGIWGALFCWCHIRFYTLLTLSGTVPGTFRNTDVENQEPTGDRSQNDSYSEVEFFVCQSRQSFGLDPEDASHTTLSKQRKWFIIYG